MSKPGIALWRRLSILLWVALIATSTTACDRMHVLKIDLDDAVLSTPSKDIKLRLRSSRDFELNKTIRDSRRWHGLYMHARDRKNEVVVFLGPTNMKTQSYVRVAFPGESRAEDVVELREILYSYNSGELKPLEVTASSNVNAAESPGTMSRAFYFAAPPELMAHGIYEHGDGLIGVERYRKDLEKERYRFIIKILIHDEPYTLDAALRFKVGSKIGGGVPGMP